MAKEADLHSKLEALSRRLDEAETGLKQQKRWHDHHRLAMGELRARYSFLKSELTKEIDELEAHGHHVSNLEANVHRWINSLDLDTKGE